MTNYFDNNTYALIMAIDILFIIFFVTSIIVELLQIFLDESKCRLKILEQIVDVDGAFKKIIISNFIKLIQMKLKHIYLYLMIKNLHITNLQRNNLESL